MANDTKNPEDFFSLMEKDQQVTDPFASDEIVFRDKDGIIKTLKDGVVVESGEDSSAAESEAPAEPVVPQHDIESDVATVIEESRIHFNDTETENRFKNIVRSRLKGVRTAPQTKDAFKRSMEQGGMGFDDEQASSVVDIINKYVDNKESELRDTASAQTFSDLQAEAEALLKNAPVVEDSPDEEAEEEPEESKTEVKDEKKEEVDQSGSVGPSNYFDANPVSPAPKKKSAPAPTPPPVATPKPEPEVKKEIKPPVSEPVTPPRPVASPDPNKPKIQDVKFEPKLTGPVEEIRSMTLTDFRRLGATPQDSIQKILEKMETIEEESFAKKVQAVKAWKENEINRLYLALGNESMEQKKSITDVIAEREQQGKPTLSRPELEAVIELNNQLRRY